MNDLTNKLFDAIAEGNETGLEKIKILCKTSQTFKQNNMGDMAIDFSSTLQVIHRPSIHHSRHRQNSPTAPLFQPLRPQQAHQRNQQYRADVYQPQQSQESATPESQWDLTPEQLTSGFNLSPLSYAVYCDQYEIFTYLVNFAREHDLLEHHQHANSPTPLWCAIYKGHSIERIQSLVEIGIDINSSYTRPVALRPMQSSIGTRQIHRHNSNSGHQNNTTPLYLAIYANRSDVVQYLLLHGAKPSLADKTFLHRLENPPNTFRSNASRTPHSPQNPATNTTSLTTKLTATFKCIEEINAAQIAYQDKSPALIFVHIGQACNVDVKFFLDYITSLVQQINKNVCLDKPLAAEAIPGFLDIFAQIIQHPLNPQPEWYDYFQQHVLLEIEGHDMTNSSHKIFESNELKHQWFMKHSNKASWYKTATTLSKQTDNTTPISQPSYKPLVTKRHQTTTKPINSNKQVTFALCRACREGKIDRVKELYTQGTSLLTLKKGFSPLYEAIQGGTIEIIKFISDKLGTHACEMWHQSPGTTLEQHPTRTLRSRPYWNIKSLSTPQTPYELALQHNNMTPLATQYGNIENTPESTY